MLTEQMLLDAEVDTQTLANVVNGAATDPDVLNRAGLSIKTLARVMAEITTASNEFITNLETTTNAILADVSSNADIFLNQLGVDAAALLDDLATDADAIIAQRGYEPPVAYAAALNIVRASQTVMLGGVIYAPVITELPFVTGAVMDPDQWYMVTTSWSVPSRAALKNIAATDGQALYLTEPGREGLFVFSAADLHQWVTWDAAHGASKGEFVFVAPASDATGNSGAWVRQDKILMPEMGGCGLGGVGADDTQVILQLFKLCAELKRPCLSTGEKTYPVGTGDGSNMRVGTLDGVAVPAWGKLDGFQMLGKWRFVGIAGKTMTFEFNRGKGIRIGDVDFDILSGATSGHGQLRWYDCTYIIIGRATKIGTEAQMALYVEGGGSVVSIQNNTEFLYCKEAVVEWAGVNASAVFVIGANAYWFDHIREVGGEDAYDVSGMSDLTAGRPFWGCGELYGELVGEVVDAGNAPGGHIGKIIAKNVNNVVNAKAEVSGDESNGTNNLKIGIIDAKDWDANLFEMGGGVTTDQTVHNIEIGSIIATSTIATAATRVCRMSGGDNLLDPTHGFKLGHLFVRANNGTCFEWAAMLNAVVENVDSNMPTALIDNTGSGGTLRNERHGHLFMNWRVNGNITGLMRGTTFINVVAAGSITVTEGRHNRYVRSGSRNSQTLGLNLMWEKSGDKDVDVRDCFGVNCGLGGAANQYALSVFRNGGTISVTGVRIRDFVIEDLQRNLVFTSGGVAAPAVGDAITGATSGATAVINKITLTGGSWAGGDAAGTLLLRDVQSEFSAAEVLKITGSIDVTDGATVTGASVATATTSGFRSGNMTTDECRFEGITSRGVNNHGAFGFQGANSYNDPGNRLQAVVNQRSAATTLTMQYANRITQMTVGANFTFDNNGNVFPIDTVFKLQRTTAGAVAIAAINGAVLKSAGGLTTIAQNGEAWARVISLAPLTLQLTGDLV